MIGSKYTAIIPKVPFPEANAPNMGLYVILSPYMVPLYTKCDKRIKTWSIDLEFFTMRMRKFYNAHAQNIQCARANILFKMEPTKWRLAIT